MLRILGTRQPTCAGWRRRDVLRAGGAGLLGLSANHLLSAEEAGLVQHATAKSVLFVFLFGGPSQLETFDLKPEAAERIRGPYRPIACQTPGLLMGEKLPRLAQISDRYAVVRTVNHPQNDHNACHYIQTGRPMPIVPRGAAGVDATDKDWPALGSVVDYLDVRSGRAGDVPGYVYLPNPLGHIQGYDRLGQYAGWLGRQHNALATSIRKQNATDNPYFRDCTDEELQFRLKELDGNPEVTLDRLAGRRGLLQQLDDQRRQLDQSLRLTGFDQTRERAFTLATSQALRDALDIRQESAALRDRYGRHLFGQSAVVARRMLEAGARFVTLLWDCPDGYSWDSHIHNHDVDKHLLPGLDQTLSALLLDMEDRGLLDETLVVCVGEMGRTPVGKANWGRDHWSYCFPALLAGGGIRGGVLWGRSDRDAAYPLENGVSPEDLAATILHSLGIDPESRILDQQGRPVSLVENGTPLTRLFG